jgi:hypothetical protein
MRARTCTPGVTHCTTVCAHVYTERGALHRGVCARVHRAWRIAPRCVCTCTRSVAHCTTVCVHVYTERGALHHGVCARVHRAWCIAPRCVCTFTRGVANCTTVCVHVPTHRAALRHTLCARAHPARHAATWSRCDAKWLYCSAKMVVLRRSVYRTEPHQSSAARGDLAGRSRDGRTTLLYFLWKCFSMSRWRMSTMIGRPWGQA